MFKIGDKVRGIGEHDFMDIEGYIGVIVARTGTNEPIWLVDFGKAFDGHTGHNDELETATGWNVPESKLELIEDNPNVKIIQNGLVVIAKRGENAGIARCNPADEFNLKTGIDLALKRLEEKENYEKPFVPETGKPYYRISWTTHNDANEAFFMPDFFADALMVALKATYRTKEEAEAHVDEIHAKMQKMLDYAKSL